MDMSESYVAAARRRWGTRGTFRVGLAEEIETMDIPAPDIVLLIGVLHHLDDEQVARLFDKVAPMLALNGRVIAIDPTYVQRQHPVARLLISYDRGRNVRTEPHYRELASPVFTRIKTTVENRLLRIPYDHVIMECSR